MGDGGGAVQVNNLFSITHPFYSLGLGGGGYSQATYIRTLQIVTSSEANLTGTHVAYVSSKFPLDFINACVRPCLSFLKAERYPFRHH